MKKYKQTEDTLSLMKNENYWRFKKININQEKSNKLYGKLWLPLVNENELRLNYYLKYECYEKV